MFRGFQCNYWGVLVFKFLGLRGLCLQDTPIHNNCAPLKHFQVYVASGSSYSSRSSVFVYGIFLLRAFASWTVSLSTCWLRSVLLFCKGGCLLAGNEFKAVVSSRSWSKHAVFSSSELYAMANNIRIIFRFYLAPLCSFARMQMLSFTLTYT